MATAKRKTSAKRTAKKPVKYAAKTTHAAATAANRTAHSAANHFQSAAKTGQQWASKGAADWQKGASEWAKQSAKLYQFPNNGDVAATVQNATENMFKAGSDMMNQFFGKAEKAGSKASDAFGFGNSLPNFNLQSFGMPSLTSIFEKAAPQLKSFDPSKAQAKLSEFARESAEQMSKSATNANRAIEEVVELSRENAQTFAEVSNVAVSVSKEVGAELIGYLNKAFSQNVELSKQILTCRTLNDMFDLATSITKTNLDGFFSESVKLSEKIFQCATDVSEPLNERLSDTTERLSKAMAA